MSGKPKPEDQQKILDAQTIGAEIFTKYPPSDLFDLGEKGLEQALKEVVKAGEKGNTIMISAKPGDIGVQAAGAMLEGQMMSYAFTIQHLIRIQSHASANWKALQDYLKKNPLPASPFAVPGPLHDEDAYGMSGQQRPIER
ncbi:hypothetical protein [Roseicyclus sp.]|uniref:hypothetical protein n=1 Tax=Roseicyclus sp. TaxID=1914329 RepID=UPI003F6A2DD0